MRHPFFYLWLLFFMLSSSTFGYLSWPASETEVNVLIERSGTVSMYRCPKEHEFVLPPGKRTDLENCTPVAQAGTDTFTRSLLALLPLRTSLLPTQGSIEEILRDAFLQEERGARAPEGNSPALAPLIPPLMQLLEWLEMAQSPHRETTDRAVKLTQAYGWRLQESFTPTFSDGTWALKRGRRIRAANLEEGCSLPWLPASLLTILGEGPQGVADKAVLVKWMQVNFKDEREAASSSFLAWQDLFETKKGSNAEIGYRARRYFFQVQLQPESVRWMRSNQSRFQRILDARLSSSPLGVDALEVEDRNFTPVDGDSYGVPLCVLRVPVSPSLAGDQVDWEMLQDRYGASEPQIRLAASVFSEVDALLNRKKDGDLLAALDRVFGRDLPTWNSIRVKPASPKQRPPASAAKKEEVGRPVSAAKADFSRTIQASIAHGGEQDEYPIRIDENGTYTFETIERNPMTHMVLELKNSQGSSLAENNLGGDGLLNARIKISLNPGNYKLVARHRHASGTGNYTLRYTRSE